MFTGIIDHVGRIVQIDKENNKLRLGIQSQFNHLELGESIAVDGVCLTVTGYEGSQFYCEVSPETLAISTLHCLTLNQPVNLERALLLTSRLGGHVVTGHVDTIFTLSIKTVLDQFVELEFTSNQEFEKSLIIKKGSIAINGVSLTINEVNSNSFRVMLIPHTLEQTTFSLLAVGSKVNIEYDMIAKMVARHCQLYLERCSDA